MPYLELSDQGQDSRSVFSTVQMLSQLSFLFGCETGYTWLGQDLGWEMVLGSSLIMDTQNQQAEPLQEKVADAELQMNATRMSTVRHGCHVSGHHSLHLGNKTANLAPTLHINGMAMVTVEVGELIFT